MKVQYLFDSKGEWIAFRKGNHLFTPTGTWIGWFPWGDDYAVDRHGEYVGTIYLGRRLYRFTNAEPRLYPGPPDAPGFQGYPGAPAEYPRREENGWLPAAADDIARALVLS